MTNEEIRERVLQRRKKMKRSELFDKIMKLLKDLGKDLNTIGNDDLTDEDYIRIMQIERTLEGYKRTY